MLAFWFERFTVGQQAKNTESHYHMPHRVHNMIVLFGLKERVAHESDHHQHTANGQENGHIFLGGEQFLSLATLQAPAHRNDADAS